MLETNEFEEFDESFTQKMRIRIQRKILKTRVYNIEVYIFWNYIFKLSVLIELIKY